MMTMEIEDVNSRIEGNVEDEKQEIKLESEPESDNDDDALGTGTDESDGEEEGENPPENRKIMNTTKIKKEKDFGRPNYSRPKFRTLLRRKRRNEYDPVEEARLERIVFGDSADVINNLKKEEEVEDSNLIERKSFSEQSKIRQTAKVPRIKIESDSDSDFNWDSASDEDGKDHSEEEKEESTNERKVAWVDEDDVEYTVNKALNDQRRRLPGKRTEKTYNELLRKKYISIVSTPKWAELDRPDKDEDDLSDEEILKHSNHLEVTKGRKNLPKGIIDLKALNPINKSTHNEGPIVSSLEFHPSSMVASVAGSSGILSLFQVDGKENTKLNSVKFEKFPISKAKFLKEGTEILVGSPYHAFCHSYDLIAGKTHKIPLPTGITNMKNFVVSPDGKFVALCGRMGEIHLLSATTKELIKTFKMNKKCQALAFTPDNAHLISHGESEEIYTWDLKSRMCVNRAIDDGCLSALSLSISPSGQFLATGSKQGAVNIYQTKNILHSKNPQPEKILLNLVTPITCLKFNPTSEILAMSSKEKENALKLAHLPSFTIFSNFPTFQTRMSNPLQLDFSPASGFLGVTNNRHSAFLYRLKHFGNY